MRGCAASGSDDLPAGALANVVNGRLVMEAVVVSPDGLEVIRDEIDGDGRERGDHWA